MPELPEVEVVRRGLQSSVLGQPVQGVCLRAPSLRWPTPDGLDQKLRGQPLQAVERRGKYLLLRFAPGCLIVHLGMSGTLRFLAQPRPPERHDHFDLQFPHGLLRLRDPRRFGALLWHPAEDGDPVGHPLLARLGVEPFSDVFDGALLHRATRGRRLPIKQLLLGGTVVVGVGNIYASESLFRAGILPTTACGRIGLERYVRLAQAIRDTLAEAIGRGGSSLRDFIGSDGESGYFQLDCFVYGRAGQPCRRCGTPVRMRTQQQRATYWCPACQH